MYNFLIFHTVTNVEWKFIHFPHTHKYKLVLVWIVSKRVVGLKKGCTYECEFIQIAFMQIHSFSLCPTWLFSHKKWVKNCIESEMRDEKAMHNACYRFVLYEYDDARPLQFKM